MTITATFTPGLTARLLPEYARECAQAGNDCDLTQQGDEISGPAQQVMFFIGHVAAHGEDGLLAARS